MAASDRYVTAPIARPTVAVMALGQKSVLKKGTAKNGERPSRGRIFPSRRPSTSSIVSVMSTSIAALANAGSASAGWPTYPRPPFRSGKFGTTRSASE